MTDRPLPRGSTLLVDLDGVVAEQMPRLCTHLEDAYGVSIAPDAVDDWSFPIPDHDVHIGDVINELMADRPAWYFGGMDPRPGVDDALAALADDYRIEIATHRWPDTHEISKAWLDEHGIHYDGFHEEVPADKGALPGDALVDDYHGNVANALSAGKEGVLMRHPYSDPSACRGAHVADSWADVRTIFGAES